MQEQQIVLEQPPLEQQWLYDLTRSKRHVPHLQPTYHLTSPYDDDCMPFDPNGAIFWKGRYHLGFIVGNEETCDRHFWWGHVSSVDMVEWKLHPPMLGPCPGDPENGIYSGNAFVDKSGRVALHYHGWPVGNCVAFNADDDLERFVKHSANPVMKDPGWDPYTWLEDGVYYSISGAMPPAPSSDASLYKCTDEDQTDWTLVGQLLSHDLPDVEPDEDLSGPDLFQLGERRVLLCISHKRGTRYYLGRFENEQFHPEEHVRMNWPGGACFALETLLDDQGRRIFWAWAVGGPACMTLPRVLSMNASGTMLIEPAEEIDALRRNHRNFEGLAVEPDSELNLDDVRGGFMELRVRFDPQDGECGVKLRRSPDGQEETAVLFDAERKAIRIDMAKSTLDKTAMPKRYFFVEGDNPEVTAQEAPLHLAPGEAVDLRIYIDGSMLEVFANGRQCLTQRIYPTRDDSLGVSLFSIGDAATFTSVDAWDMAPITISDAGLRSSDVGG